MMTRFRTAALAAMISSTGAPPLYIDAMVRFIDAYDK